MMTSSKVSSPIFALANKVGRSTWNNQSADLFHVEQYIPLRLKGLCFAGDSGKVFHVEHIIKDSNDEI